MRINPYWTAFVRIFFIGAKKIYDLKLTILKRNEKNKQDASFRPVWHHGEGFLSGFGIAVP